MSELRFASGARARTLLAMAEAIVPTAADLDAGQRDELLAIVDHVVTGKPPAMQRQLGLFLTLIRLRARLRHLRPIERLSVDQRTRLLRRLERHPVGLLRKGFWGVRVLIQMGYYTRDGIGDELGWRPRLQGGGLAERTS